MRGGFEMSAQRCLIAVLALVPSLFSVPQPAYDVLIQGGRVLDGAGNPWVAASVAISGDRVARDRRDRLLCRARVYRHDGPVRRAARRRRPRREQGAPGGYDRDRGRGGDPGPGRAARRLFQYAYTAGGTGLEACIPAWAAEGGPAERNKRLKDPEIRKRLKREMKTGSFGWWNIVEASGGWKNVVIAAMPQGGEKRYEGMSIADIARELRKSPEDTVLDLVSSFETRISALYFMMHEDDVRAAMQFPWVSVGSDAAAGSRETARGKGHPRAYGNFPRVIARYVRELHILTLENAVRRMTSLPAGKLHIAGRGLLREGSYADVVVFDFDKIEDTATYADPHQYPRGIPYVLVNGHLVIDRGEHTGSRPGKIIYGPGHTGR